MKKHEQSALVFRYRNFRLQHHISREELAKACGVSAQRISQIELGEVPTLHKQAQLVQAMEYVLLQRCQSAALAMEDLGVQKQHLFEWAQERR